MNRGNWLLATGFLLLAVLNSCKEDTGNAGANVLPANDLIGAFYTDTTSVVTSMYLKDSVITDDGIPALLGSYNDPVFGTVKASIYAQVLSPTDAATGSVPWVNDSVPLDSVVLILPYITEGGFPASYYGNLDAQTVIVDTVETTIRSAKAYYADTSLQHDAAHPIGMQIITPPNPYLNNTAVRVKLNNAWVNYIKGQTIANSNYYNNFNSLVKGLFITVSNPFQLPGQGGILYIYFGPGSTAGLNFYYHDKSAPTIPYYAFFPMDGTYFTHTDLNHAASPFANMHPSGKHDSIPANDLIYVQSAGGPWGRINFPNLYQNWKGMKHILINKAEVDLTVDAQECPNPFIPPSQLYLLATDKYGNPYETPDQLNTGLTGYPEGAYDYFNQTYTFIITQYIQKVIDGKDTDRGMYIYPANAINSAERVVLYGAQHDAALPTAQRAKFRLYYTPLKN